ncbi:hypothetical protein MXD81_39420 [Microbacteriaceae bacterium K1510]|nr:hypothetical protein [Microbacteriaceae bacterium K1510]
MLAIFAIALHTMLWALGATAMAFAGSTDSLDPFLVICHSGGSTDVTTDETPGAPLSKPTSACDHCNLCTATGTAAAPDVVLIGRLLPERIIALLSPVSVPKRNGVASDPKLARGPPQQA